MPIGFAKHIRLEGSIKSNPEGSIDAIALYNFVSKSHFNSITAD